MSILFKQRLENYGRQFEIFKQKLAIEKFRKKNEGTGRFREHLKHLIISGEPRGGTTWLAEVLSGKNRLIIWEPLHYKIVAQYKLKNFGEEIGHMPYIPQGTVWPEATDYFNALFNGSELNYSSIFANPAANFNPEIVDSLMFKFCRANLLLPWLVDNFNILPIYLVRHPLSVISSQYRHSAFSGMDEKASIFANQKSKYRQIFEKYRANIEGIKNREEMFANWWALNNVVPLTHEYNNNKWITVSYESLVSRPQFEIERISNRLGIRFSPDIFSRMLKPSATTKSGSGILTGENQLLNWERNFTTAQIDNILKTINSYGIDAYSTNPQPNYKKLGYEE